MIKQRMAFPAIVALTLVLSGCDLFGSSQATAPPPPPEAVQPRPVVTNTPTPSPGSVVGPGQIIYVFNGRVAASAADGVNVHDVFTPDQRGVLRDLAVSPDGHYLAFTVNASQLILIDLTVGQVTKIDESSSDRLSSLAWSPANDALYYHRMVLGEDAKPSHSIIMRAVVPPNGPPEKSLDFDLAFNSPIVPVAVWRGGLVLIHQVDLTSGTLGQWVIYDASAKSLTPLLKDYGLWDVSPNRTDMLLFNTADLEAGPSTASVPLYRAQLDPANGAVGVTPLTAQDQSVHLETARFAPDGLRIAALQFVTNGESLRRQIVALLPAAGGAYQLTRLAPDDSADDVAFAWAVGGLIVQRLRGGQSELWFVPLDGTAGRLITSGEQPLVVPSR
jgi:hypothetical protein